MRVFIGIEFENNVKDYLQKVQEVLRPNMLKGDLTRYGNFHLTLKYIGHVRNGELDTLYDCVDYVSSKMTPFSIKIGNLNTFHKGNSDIVWVGVTDGQKDLKRLFHIVEESTVLEGFHPENRKYRPHITVGKKMVFNSISDSNFLPYYDDEIKVKAITLFESDRIDGVLTYTPLYKVNLESA